MREPWEWDEKDLQELVRDSVTENLTLNYKACDSLQNTDGKKAEISKDVSALANSAGGTIVYGIEEVNRVATSLDTGFDPNATTKEWLEQVINSRIQRKIDGIRINPVELKSIHPGRVAYVVYVPQSVRAPHQASDKKFYKRYNFESVPMEEYEIRDVARRLTMPILRLELEMSAVPDQPDGTCDLLAVIVNESPEAALYAIVDIWFEETFTVQHPGLPWARTGNLTLNRTDAGGTKSEERPMFRWQRPWKVPNDFPIFEGTRFTMPSLPVRVSFPIESQKKHWIGWLVRAPGFTSALHLY